jgi:cell division septum initiation protein DivIVA
MSKKSQPQFKVTSSGYDYLEVDNFVDLMAKQIVDLEASGASLKQQIVVLGDIEKKRNEQIIVLEKKIAELEFALAQSVDQSQEIATLKKQLTIAQEKLLNR